MHARSVDSCRSSFARSECIGSSVLFFTVRPFRSPVACGEVVLRPLLTAGVAERLAPHGSDVRLLRLPDTNSSPPWIRRPTFAAQAPDLPMRLNEDGFAMVGSLAWPHRPCIGFLSVASQLCRSESQLINYPPKDLRSRTGDFHPTSCPPCQAYQRMRRETVLNKAKRSLRGTSGDRDLILRLDVKSFFGFGIGGQR